MGIGIETSRILGLNKEEILLLEVLTGKSLRINDLSILTKIPRTSLYYILPRLEERRFIQQSKVGKKTYWSKNKKIKEVYEKTLDILSSDEERTDSFSYTISKETKVVLYKNEKMIQIFENIASLAPRTRIYGLQPDTSFLQAIKYVPLEVLVRINNTIKQKNIIVEGIIHERSMDSIQHILNKNDLRTFLESFGGRSADTVKLPHNYLNTTKSEIYLYNNTIAIINWHEKFAVTVQNQDVFQLAMEMFKSTKYLLQRYDQNEKIARKLVDLG